MTTTEQERITDESLDGQDFEVDSPQEAHLYQQIGADHAHCGLHYLDDPHAQVHTKAGVSSSATKWEKGQTSCRVCGIPLCLECLLRVS